MTKKEWVKYRWTKIWAASKTGRTRINNYLHELPWWAFAMMLLLVALLTMGFYFRSKCTLKAAAWPKHKIVAHTFPLPIPIAPTQQAPQRPLLPVVVWVSPIPLPPLVQVAQQTTPTQPAAQSTTQSAAPKTSESTQDPEVKVTRIQRTASEAPPNLDQMLSQEAPRKRATIIREPTSGNAGQVRIVLIGNCWLDSPSMSECLGAAENYTDEDIWLYAGDGDGCDEQLKDFVIRVNGGDVKFGNEGGNAHIPAGKRKGFHVWIKDWRGGRSIANLTMNFRWESQYTRGAHPLAPTFGMIPVDRN